MAKSDTMEVEESFQKSEKRKRNCHRMTSRDESSVLSARQYKRIVLSLTKPSYLLQLGPGLKSFRQEHRERLCGILRELVRRHNWREASGVVSVLMQGTKKDKSLRLNRLKYSVCLEILKNIQVGGVNSLRIDHIHDTWISRTSSAKNNPAEDRSLVYLEQIQRFLTEGSEEDASQAAISLMQHREFGSCPMSYMVIGLTFYQLWYSKFLKNLQWKDKEHSPSQAEMSGTRSDDPFGPSHGHSASYSLDTKASLRCKSETSVMNDRRISLMSGKETDREVSMEVDEKVKSTPPRFVQPLRAYATSDENQASLQNDVAHTFDASLISVLEGMESWLFPLRLPQNPDHHIQILNNSNYKEAVKYLRLALHSTPPMLAALHPLVQLLLIGGQVDAAMNEVEELCKISNAAFPFRIRASILETFNGNNNMLTDYYEAVLKKDPTCSHSLSKLIVLHQFGEYSPESLVEMIALHLDATYADPNTWKEFALCFLQLCHCDEDRMSVCLNGNGGERKQHVSVRYNRTPKVFTDGKSGNAWKFRCKWWLTRHFSSKILSSEIAKGDMEILTYKAVSGSYMYGQDFGYVMKVYSLLQNDGNRDLFMFLQMHRQNSICMYPNWRAT